MKLKSLFIKTIAMGAVASLAVNCHAKKVDDNPLLFFALSNTITSLAQGNCAISVNITALSYQNAIKTAVDNTIVAGGPIYASDAAASTAFITHYNAVNGTNVDKAGLLAAQYNKKFDTFFTDLGTWNGTTRAAYLKAVYNAIVAGLPTGAIGTGLLACARIPKANCSFAGATTANQESDLASARKTYDAIYNNSDCRKDLTILQTLKDNIFKGAPATVQSLQDGAYTNPATNGNTASFATTQSILAEKGYPKFGSFVSLGFGALMPVKDGNTAFSLTTTEYVAGSNIAFTNASTVNLLEWVIKEFTVATGTTLLTPVTEVAYSLSTNGTAASAYNTARGLANGAYVSNSGWRRCKELQQLLPC
jgi:hypothetical protein